MTKTLWMPRRRALQLGAAALAVPMLARRASAAEVLRIGMVTPETGPAAAFGEPTKWIAEAAQLALKDGITLGGQTYGVEILTRDSQSTANRAAEVAAELINEAAIITLTPASTADTVMPVADQCELKGVPCVTTDLPWQVFFFGRHGDPKAGFDWTYNFFFGLDQVGQAVTAMWEGTPTNRKVGLMLPNDADGLGASDPDHGFAATFRKAGFEVVDLGLYPPGSDDFSAQIADLKTSGAEIVAGLFSPPQFAVFWTQCAQQGYQPKIATPLKALLFPSAVEALGARGAGLTTEVWWTPSHPCTSSLTGQSAAEFCAAWEAATGKQWTQPLGFKHAAIEVAVDALRRAADPSAEAIGAALKATSLATIVGHVDWTARGPQSPVPNVATVPVVGGQWVKGAKYPYDLQVVSNAGAPEIPIGGTLQPIAW
jgi:branched-chain amino acid transport system substrate-binding protein